MFKRICFKGLANLCSCIGADNLFAALAVKTAKEEIEKITEEIKVILITGSCGKTTTLYQTVAAIEQAGNKVIYKRDGITYGKLLTTLFRKSSVSEKAKSRFAVFEVETDELKKVLYAVKPQVLAITNIFQDKNPEENVYENIENACKHLSGTNFVLNGDEPALFDFMKDGARRYFYGFRVNPNFAEICATSGKICPDCNNEYKYIYNTHAHLGNYSCATCGKTRPQLALGVDNVLSKDEKGATVSFDGLEINIPVPGESNIYNALCAATIAGAVGVGPDEIKGGIEELKSIPTVCEIVRVNTKEVRLLEVNNALECTEVVNSILPDKDPVYVACMISSDNVEWIDDVPFESLLNLNYHGILIGGDNLKEMTERLEKAGLDSAKFTVCEDFDAFIYSVRTNVIGKLYVLATKKAMKSLRKNMHKDKYIKKL